MENYGLTLVLMAGLPGAGKTTLAYALAREFQWQVIDKDMYKEVLSQQGLNDESASTMAYELSFASIRVALTRQRISVIFDTAALQHFILDTVREIVSSAGNVELKVILCVADRDLRNHRLRTRPYQVTNIRADPATTADYLYYFRHLPPDRLELYTSDNIAECLVQAKDHITS